MYVHSNQMRESGNMSNAPIRMSTPVANVRLFERVERVPISSTGGRYSANSYVSERTVIEPGSAHRGSKPVTDRIVCIRPLHMLNGSSDRESMNGADEQLHVRHLTSFASESINRGGRHDSIVTRSICRDSDGVSVVTVEGDGRVGTSRCSSHFLDLSADSRAHTQIHGFAPDRRSPAAHQNIDFASIKVLKTLGKGSFGEVRLALRPPEMQKQVSVVEAALPATRVCYYSEKL